MRICKTCLYPESHPLGIIINEQGICSGCLYHDEKDQLDWSYRLDLLSKLVEPYRSKLGNTYDCIVPVSGAYDSYFIMHVVANILRLKPLMVTYNKYFNTSVGIRNLARLRTTFNCDLLIQNVNPISVKKITKETLRRFGNIYWPCIAGQTVFPVQTAVRYQVPLIIWGAHQGNEQVGMFSHTNEVEMSRRYRKDHDLFGHEADDLIQVSNTICESDIHQYRYPHDSELDSVGVRGIYLGNYIRWDPKSQHELMIKTYKYETAKLSRTFDTYDFVDCYNYMGIHDQLKLAKHGYSKVLDHACREIRHKRITRNNAISLVKRYQFELPQHIDLFSSWLNIPTDSLNLIVDHSRSSTYWSQSSPSCYEFHGITNLIETAEADVFGAKSSDISYYPNVSPLYDHDPGYIIFGKGYPN